ncbi:MAG: hypothetical protein RLY30_941 [Pseudomonadota bacterium]
MKYSASWLLVLGTGLMGGSVARAARRAEVVDCIYGLDPEHGMEAQRLGVVDEVISSLEAMAPGRPEDTRPGLVVLAAPVSASAQLLKAVASQWERLGRPWVTDLGSTKSALSRAADDLRRPQAGASAFLSHCIASHPMAGSETHGPGAARAELFERARVLLSEFPETSEACRDALESFWLALGARPHPLALSEHDPLLAAISHLPHAVAYALAAQLAASPQAESAQWLHGGGLRDTTRIAGSSARLWADVFLDNREELLALMGRYQREIDTLAQAIQSQDRSRLMDYLEGAAQWRAGFQDPRSSS